MVIVCGVARSGTSMMMRMLHLGGMDVMWDDPNATSEFNPHGFYEHPLAEKVATEQPQLDMAVKILAATLPRYIEHVTNPHWPRPLPKIIVMRRDPAASADSYTAMFGVTRTAGDIQKIMADVDAAVAPHAHIDVRYDEVIDNSHHVAGRIAAFLAPAVALDIPAMAAVPDASLRHYGGQA